MTFAVLAPTKNAGGKARCRNRRQAQQAKKKFKVTATGKFLRRKAGQSHNLEHKSPKQKRSFGKDQPVADANRRTVGRMLGRSSS